MVESRKEEGYISFAVGPKMGTFDTYEMVRENGVEALAYTSVKDSLLMIQVFDLTTQRLDRALPEVLERVYIKE